MSFAPTTACSRSRRPPQVLNANAADEHTQLGNLGLAYDGAARLSQTTHAEPVVSGGGVRKPFMPFAPASHFYNGLNQRVLRENPQGQTVNLEGQVLPFAPWSPTPQPT